MKLYTRSILAAFLLISSAFSYSFDAQVKAIGDQFLNNLPPTWNASTGTWEYFDVEKCFTTPGASCYGNNPTTPYGSPSFVDLPSGLASTAFQMNQDEAVVLILRTPPQMKYYSFAQYILRLPDGLGTDYASLSDSLNQLKIGTTGSTLPGMTVFDTYTAVVWTANMNTFNQVKSLLESSGLPGQAVNLLPLPLTIPPSTTLNMGYGPNAETFNMLMRTALPSSPTSFTGYMEEKPFYVLKVGPSVHTAVSPAPVIGYASDISGTSESTLLQTALNRLVNDIKQKYWATYTLKNQTIQFSTKLGWDCIAGPSNCSGDNHDALYSLDTQGALTVTSMQDFVIVAGVNHQKTGKASYINHSVYDPVNSAGIASVADPLLTTQSALYHAGVTNAFDSRVKLYQSLYAYMISYNCLGRAYCLPIPAPTQANRVGLIYPAPFFVLGRAYLNPVTRVKPSENEIIHHRVFTGTKK